MVVNHKEIQMTAISSWQLQVIGLQFLRSRIQKLNTEENSFMFFVVGELITDIFSLIN